LFHDLGKYRREFQHMLRGGASSEATRHKQAGAAIAWDARAFEAAFAIAGQPEVPPGDIPQADDRGIADRPTPPVFPAEAPDEDSSTGIQFEEVFPDLPGFKIVGRLGEGGMGTVWRPGP
jgi:hypothetical protein